MEQLHKQGLARLAGCPGGPNAAREEKALDLRPRCDQALDRGGRPSYLPEPGSMKAKCKRAGNAAALRQCCPINATKRDALWRKHRDIAAPPYRRWNSGDTANVRARSFQLIRTIVLLYRRLSMSRRKLCLAACRTSGSYATRQFLAQLIRRLDAIDEQFPRV